MTIRISSPYWATDAANADACLADMDVATLPLRYDHDAASPRIDFVLLYDAWKARLSEVDMLAAGALPSEL